MPRRIIKRGIENMADKKSTLRDLIETGKKNGKLTTKEISDVMEEIGFDVDQVEKLYETLDAHNIEVVDEPDPDIEEFKLTEESLSVISAPTDAKASGLAWKMLRILIWGL